jgi:hypothetical protein
MFQKSFEHLLLKPKHLFPVLLLFGIGLAYIANFNGLYGQDSHEYFRYSAVLSDYFKHEGLNENFYWTVLYPLFGSLLNLIFGQGPFNLQLISIASYAGASVFMLQTLKDRNTEKSIVYYLLLTFILSPNILKSGLQVMSEPLALLFIVSSFYFYQRFLKDPNEKDFILISVTVSLAFFTRYAVILVLLPLAVHSLYIIFRQKNYRAIFLGLVILTIVSLPEYFLSPQITESITSNYFLGEWSVNNLFSKEFRTIDGEHTFRYPNIVFLSSVIWHPVFFFPFFPSCFFYKKEDFRLFERILLLGVLSYCILIGGLPFQNLRMLLPIYPVLVICNYPAILRLFNFIESKVHKRIRDLIPKGLVLLQLSFFAYLFMIFINRNYLEKRIATHIKTAGYSRVFSHDIDVGVNSYLTKDQKVKNLITDLHDFQNDDILILNLEQYERIWHNSNVESNLLEALEMHDTLRLVSLESNWVVFKLNKRR